MRGPLPAVAEQIEHWPIDRLKPYERNACTHSREQIEKIAAAKLLGLETVPVVVLDHLSDAQRRAYILADNRLALDAGWDEELLAAEFADLLADDFDLALTGFSDDEIEDLLPEFDDEPVAEGAADEDAVPEPELVPVSRKGDLWRLGRHRLLCGDSTVITDVERLMGGGRAALIACEKTGRVARLMELDPRYVDVIIRRWQEYTGKVARLDDTGETFAEVEARRDGSAVPIRPGGLMTAGRPFTESPAANDDLSSEGQVA